MVEQSDIPLMLILIVYIGFMWGLYNRISRSDVEFFESKKSWSVKDDATLKYQETERELIGLRETLNKLKVERSFIVQQKAPVDVQLFNERRNLNTGRPDKIKEILIAKQKALAVDLEKAEQDIKKQERLIKDCEDLLVQLKKEAGVFSWAIHSIGF